MKCLTQALLIATLIVATTVSTSDANAYNERVNGGVCGNPGPNFLGRRIVGGSKALPDEFPYQVILGGFEPMTIFHYLLGKPQRAMFFCGATVLNDRWIVTAAHCLTGEHKYPKNIVVGVAITNRDEISDNHGFIEKVIIHPNYNRDVEDSTRNMFDIALLKTKEPISSFAQNAAVPPCLPNKGDDGSFQIATVSGFGQIASDGPASHSLLATQVRIRSNEYCKAVYKDLFDPETMLCAGALLGGKDTCQGDSGGPLVGRKDGSYVLLGVTSFGYGCGKAFIPGVYTRVSSYTDWLIENMD